MLGTTKSCNARRTLLSEPGQWVVNFRSSWLHLVDMMAITRSRLLSLLVIPTSALLPGWRSPTVAQQQHP